MEQPTIWRQLAVALSANLASGLAGISMAWSSPATVLLLDDNTPLEEPLNSDQLGWILSLLSLGAIFGPFYVWLFLDRIGRKWTLLSSSGFFSASVFLLLFVQKLWAIYLARIFQGVTVGIVMATQPIYNAEIASDKFRGALGSLMSLFMLLFFAYISILGALVDYSSIQWACFPFCIIFPLTFVFMPETPHYYISKRNKSTALQSLKFLRGQLSEDSLLNEYDEIEVFVEKSMKDRSNFFDLFRHKEYLKALGTTVGLIIFQQLTGVNALMSNIQNIFTSTKTIDPVLFLVINSIISIITNMGTFLLVDKYGRKSLLLISSISMSLALIGFGAFFHIQNTSGDISSLVWMPATFFIAFQIAFAIGFSPIPWILVGEIFPANVKSFATSITVCICWTFSFAVSKLYPIVTDKFGNDVTIWMYGICCGFSSIFIFFVIFETKGLSIQEIQNKLK